MKNHVTVGRFSLSAALLVIALAFNATTRPAHALEVAGVTYQPQTKVGETTLSLNGAGVRKKGTTSLYTAGLYLEQKTNTSLDALQNKSAKQLRVVMLREVNGREFSDMFSKGLVTNSNDDELYNLIPEIMNLGTLIAESGKLFPGDSFVIDWSATSGTTIRVNQLGSRKPAIEVFAKPDLIAALLRIWLGEKPADANLKAALLGKIA